MTRPPTRRELLATGGRAAGAGAAIVLADASASVAAGGGGESEAARIYRLARVELLLLFCYRHVLDSPVLTHRSRTVITPLLAHEQAHVQVLAARLAAQGASAPPAPASIAVADRDLARRKVQGRLGQLRGSGDAVRLLLALEQVVTGAYFVALTKLQDPRLITLAAQIMGTEAQHEALLGELLNHGDATLAVPYGLVQGVQ